LEHAGRDGSQRQWKPLVERVEGAAAAAISFLERSVGAASGT
jgi:hypothetical protein